MIGSDDFLSFASRSLSLPDPKPLPPLNDTPPAPPRQVGAKHKRPASTNNSSQPPKRRRVAVLPPLPLGLPPELTGRVQSNSLTPPPLPPLSFRNVANVEPLRPPPSLFSPAPSPQTLNDLATMYARGYGVMRDDDLAVALFRHSARLGDSLATSNLALMYLAKRGTFLPEDIALMDSTTLRLGMVRKSQLLLALLNKDLDSMTHWTAPESFDFLIQEAAQGSPLARQKLESLMHRSPAPG